MDKCKECNCEMKYLNNSFNKNMKNILCKKNNINIKFILPFEFLFYFTTTFSLIGFYNYNYNKNKNKKIYIY